MALVAVSLWPLYRGRISVLSSMDNRILGMEVIGRSKGPEKASVITLSLSLSKEAFRDGVYQGVRGEILRSLWDKRRRRRSASLASSIKNESVGSQDDQIPL